MDQIERFIGGFRHFRRHYFENAPQLYNRLKDGQNPNCLVIGCCDSRVNPVHLFDCEPGEIFIMRNVANLVPPQGSDGPQGVLAAIEYAVCGLHVSDAIVLGHSHCGGIQALMQRGSAAAHGQKEGRDAHGGGQHLERWLDVAEPVRQRILAQMPAASEQERCRACEQAAILASLENLRAMDCVRERMAAGALRLHGWYFDLEAGQLHTWSPRAGAFLATDQAQQP